MMKENFSSATKLLRPTKKERSDNLAAITLGYVLSGEDGKSPKRIKILFDSGSAATLISHSKIKSLPKQRDKTTNWTTKAGEFKTKYKCNLQFTLPALHEHWKNTWSYYVDETTSSSCKYDMIIGRDLMQEIGINLLFSTAEIVWDNASIAMQPIEKLEKDSVKDLEQDLMLVHDPVTTDAERIQRIIDNKYCPADLSEVVNKCQNIDEKQKGQMHKLLTKFEHLLDGILGL